jgi:threonine dehydrogenase-like Zn-dependent dehydrogenase
MGTGVVEAIGTDIDNFAVGDEVYFRGNDTMTLADGSFVWQGHYGSEPVSMHFVAPHGRRLRMFFPSDDGLQLCRRAVIKNMAMGALQWEQCITHRVPFAAAPAMFERIHAGKDKDIIGVVINWQV